MVAHSRSGTPGLVRKQIPSNSYGIQDWSVSFSSLPSGTTHARSGKEPRVHFFGSAGPQKGSPCADIVFKRKFACELLQGGQRCGSGRAPAFEPLFVALCGTLWRFVAPGPRSA
eukprot:Amastigsp_a180791_12.p3 type:complete len:114 gc:universal Amastigsp_a180791_12:604-263(-)